MDPNSAKIEITACRLRRTATRDPRLSDRKRWTAMVEATIANITSVFSLVCLCTNVTGCHLSDVKQWQLLKKLFAVISIRSTKAISNEFYGWRPESVEPRHYDVQFLKKMSGQAWNGIFLCYTCNQIEQSSKVLTGPQTKANKNRTPSSVH